MNREIIQGMLLRLIPAVIFAACASGLAFAAQSIEGVSREALEAAIVLSLHQQGEAEVEISRVTVVKGRELFQGEAVSVSGARFERRLADNSVRFEVGLQRSGRTLGNALVDVSYDRIVEVYVPARPLASGSVLAPEDVNISRKRQSRVPSGAIKSLDSMEGKALRMGVGPGVVLRADHFRDDTKIKRGHKVTVVMESKNMVLTTNGALRSVASIGGTVKVYCDSSRKELSGVLVDAETVRVKI